MIYDGIFLGDVGRCFFSSEGLGADYLGYRSSGRELAALASNRFQELHGECYVSNLYAYVLT